MTQRTATSTGSPWPGWPKAPTNSPIGCWMPSTDQIHVTRQRRAMRVPRRFPTMTLPARVAAAAVDRRACPRRRLPRLRQIRPTRRRRAVPFDRAASPSPAALEVPALTETYSSARNGFTISYPSAVDHDPRHRDSRGQKLLWGDPALDTISTGDIRLAMSSAGARSRADAGGMAPGRSARLMARGQTIAPRPSPAWRRSTSTARAGTATRTATQSHSSGSSPDGRDLWRGSGRWRTWLHIRDGRARRPRDVRRVPGDGEAPGRSRPWNEPIRRPLSGYSIKYPSALGRDPGDAAVDGWLLHRALLRLDRRRLCHLLWSLDEVARRDAVRDLVRSL